MKKRYFVPLLFVLLVASVCLTACGSRNNYKTGTWSAIESTYGTQGFHCTPNADMNIDGYLDESAWTEKCTSEFNHTELGCSFVVRSYYDVSGMYFGMTARDYNVIYARKFGMQQSVNSGFILSVVPDGDTTLSHKFSVGFDAGNTPRAYGLYNYMSRTTVQGVVNSGETDGMTTEVFVPWSNIGMNVGSAEDVPETVRVFVRYNVISGDVGSGGTNMYPGLGNDWNYGKMYNFGATGYCAEDKNGWLLGDAADGYAKSTDYDFSRADEGVFGTDASGDRTLSPNNKSIFLRNVYADRFVYTMKIRPQLEDGSAVLGKSSRSTVNLMAQTVYGMYGFGISLMDGSVNSNTVRVTRISYVGRVWTDPYEWQAFYTTQHGGSFAGDGVTLTLIKDGDTYYYVYGTPEDGVYIGYDRNVIHSGAACPGVISCNSAAVLSDIRCTTYGRSDEDNAEMTRILNRLGAARVTATAVGGGAVTLAEDVVSIGGDAEMSFRYAGGSYVIDKVERVTGESTEDITADVAEKAVHGKYFLKNVTTDTAVNVTFRQTETRTATVTLKMPAGVTMPATLISAEGKTDKTKYYEVRTGSATVDMQLPAGEYNFRVIAAGLTTAAFELDVTQNATHEVELTKAKYGGNVTVNGVQLSSSQEWDYSESNNDAASRPSGTPQNAIAWMSDTASGDFTFTVEYTVTSSVDTDPNGGFAISDGSTTYYVFLLGNGVRIIDATHNLGWQNRTYSAFNTAVSGNLVGKKIALTLARTDGVWTFTATYGSATINQTLKDLTASWGGANKTDEAFALPSGEVAIGMTATDIAVTYENISLAAVAAN